jgi:hypothetical protein
MVPSMISPSVIDAVLKAARANLERVDTVLLQSSVVRELRKIGARFKPNACRNRPLHRIGPGRGCAVAITRWLP